MSYTLARANTYTHTVKISVHKCVCVCAIHNTRDENGVRESGDGERFINQFHTSLHNAYRKKSCVRESI